MDTALFEPVYRSKEGFARAPVAYNGLNSVALEGPAQFAHQSSAKREHQVIITAGIKAKGNSHKSSLFTCPVIRHIQCNRFHFVNHLVSLHNAHNVGKGANHVHCLVHEYAFEFVAK